MNDSRTPAAAPLNFSSLLVPEPDKRALFKGLIDRINAADGAYHQLDFGDCGVISGHFDMVKYLHHYHLPDSLAGKSVLDVGTASGYFTLECARRGAEVTAIDIYEACILDAMMPSLSAKIRYEKQDLYKLTAGFGQYDLLICGSVLLHLPDPLGALRAMRSVCLDRLIISTCATADSADNAKPLCEFVGMRAAAAEGDYYSYWSISAAALRNMLRVAGFTRIEHELHFTMSTEPGRPTHHIPHVVMSARV